MTNVSLSNLWSKTANFRYFSQISVLGPSEQNFKMSNCGVSVWKNTSLICKVLLINDKNLRTYVR